MHLRDMSIGVVGNGVVGGAIARSYTQHVKNVRVYDVVAERCTHPLALVLACDVVFVCLPTPQKKDSLELDTSVLDKFFCSTAGSGANLVLKSTVPIGYTRYVSEWNKLPNLVHSPEFLTARCANIDAQMPPVNIIGIPHKIEKPNQCAEMLNDLYTTRFPHIWVQGMEADESEAVKLFVNGFYAVKVAYWNEVRTLSNAKGLQWDTVINGVLAAGMIHPSHTQVPGPDGKYGFGGQCLPKDLAYLSEEIQRAGCDYMVTRAASIRNDYDRKRADQ